MTVELLIFDHLLEAVPTPTPEAQLLLIFMDGPDPVIEETEATLEQGIEIGAGPMLEIHVDSQLGSQIVMMAQITGFDGLVPVDLPAFGSVDPPYYARRVQIDGHGGLR